MTKTQPVQAVIRGLRVLEALADVGGSGGLGVLEVARAVDLSPATTHRLLATLASEGYVAQIETTSRYELGPRLFALATVAESDISVLRAAAARTMEALRDKLGETVNLSVLDRLHITYVDQVESARSVRAFNRTGNRVPAHASAAGKALLAFQGDAVLQALRSGGPLAAFTPTTITEPEELIVALSEVRGQGYALDRGEHDEGVICVAAPVGRPGRRRPLAALSVSGPADRMGRHDLCALGLEVAQMAAEIDAAHG